eukprot:TRINITY_DN33962_c1_g2_i1.p1 TRINITY_DN33962_c1_g2~~TRINITY_DN33962_c1_g2_i1.p1  ORF type:complete len:370 (+),score=48.52 TRINITY_DN33962_c1_g2_i1:66-1175(+)
MLSSPYPIRWIGAAFLLIWLLSTCWYLARNSPAASPADAALWRGSDSLRGRAQDEEGEEQQERQGVHAAAAAEQKELYCFALVTKKEVDARGTIQLVADNLARACDGFNLFSTFSDARLGVVRAFDEEANARGFKRAMREQVVLGVWRHLRETADIDRYNWFLKVDADSWLRPSTLRGALRSWTEGTEVESVLSIGYYADAAENADQATDGFFVAVPRLLAGRVLDVAKSSRACDSVLSGHDERSREGNDYAADASLPADEEDAYKCAEMLGMKQIIRPMVDSSGRKLVLNEPLCGLGLGAACQRPGAPLQCSGLREGPGKDEGGLEFEQGVPQDCSRQVIPSCLSPSFVSVHSVLTASCHEALSATYG